MHISDDWGYCDCPCHTPHLDMHIDHCIPCCSACPHCGRNITGSLNAHIREEHKAVPAAS